MNRPNDKAVIIKVEEPMTDDTTVVVEVEEHTPNDRTVTVEVKDYRARRDAETYRKVREECGQMFERRAVVLERELRKLGQRS